MARTKRIFREWQHPRASNGRFARKGSPEWVKAAAEKFRHAEESLRAGTHAPGTPSRGESGPSRPRISRAAKAERALASHDASVVTGLGRQPVQGPERPPASKRTPRVVGQAAKRTVLERDLPKRPDGSPVTGGDYVKVKGSGQVLKVSKRDTLMGTPGYQLMTRDDQDHTSTTFFPANAVEHAPAPSRTGSVADRSRGVDTPRDSSKSGGVSTTTNAPELKPGTEAHRRAAARVHIRASGPGMTPTLNRKPQPGDLVYAGGLNRAGTVVREIKRNRSNGYDVQWEGEPYTRHQPDYVPLHVVDVPEALRRQEASNAPAAPEVKAPEAKAPGPLTTRGRIGAEAKTAVLAPQLSPEQRANYDKLLGNGPGEGLVQHKQARQIVEQMEAHGWTVTGQSPQVNLITFKAPDGRTLRAQFLLSTPDAQRGGRSSKPQFSEDKYNGADLTFKAALARVVTPTHEHVASPNVDDALKRAGLPELPRRYGMVSDDSSRPALIAAHKDLGAKGMYGGRGLTVEETTANLRAAAQRNRENAKKADELYGYGSARDSRSVQWEKSASEYEQVANELEKMQKERAAYEAERERRAGLPLDIRPSARSAPAKKAAPRKAAAPKPAMQQASDTIAEQRGLPKIDTATEPFPAEPSQMDVIREGAARTRASVEAGTNPATAYDTMNRGTLLVLARQAGVPVRGKSNGEIAAALHAKDAERKAAKAAKLNPASVGTPSTQHETHTPAAGGDLYEADRAQFMAHLNRGDRESILRQARDYKVDTNGKSDAEIMRDTATAYADEQRNIRNRNAGINATLAAGGQVRTVENGIGGRNLERTGVNGRTEPTRRYQTFAERMAGDMPESDRMRAHAESDRLRAEARAREAEVARQAAEREANDTRSEREKLTAKLQDERDLDRLGRYSHGQVDPRRTARIKAMETRLAELDTEDRKAKIKNLGVQKGDTIKTSQGEFEVAGKTPDGYLRVILPGKRHRGSVDPKWIQGVTKAPKAEAAREAAPGPGVPGVSTRTRVADLVQRALDARNHGEPADEVAANDALRAELARSGAQFERPAASVTGPAYVHVTGRDRYGSETSGTGFVQGASRVNLRKGRSTKTTPAWSFYITSTPNGANGTHHQVIVPDDGRVQVLPTPRMRPPVGPATGVSALEAAPLRIHLGKLRSTPEGMTPQQAQAAAAALEHYRDIGYLDLNRDLRIGKTNNKTIARTMEGLHGAFAASPLQRDVVTYRGTADLKMIGSPGPGSAVGKTWVDPAPGSTTIDEATARGFGQGGAVLRIRVPAGIGAVQLSDAPGRGKADDREGELLLQDGLTYRVVGDRTERGVRVLDVEASAKGAGPKAEAAPKAAPAVTWVDKRTGAPVANPSQVDIVRGNVVTPEKRAAHLEEQRATRAANLEKARGEQQRLTREQLMRTTDPKDNAAKIRAMEAGNLDAADLYKTANAGPSGQLTHALVGRIRHTPNNPNGEYQVKNRDGETVGWVSRTVRNGKGVYSVHSQGADDEQRLEGWAGELATAADVLTNGEFVARGYGADARRASAGTFERYKGRNMSLDELELSAARDELAKAKANAAREGLAPYARKSADREVEHRQRQLDELLAEQRDKANGGRVDTPRDSSAKVEVKPTTTEANMVAKAKSTGEPQLGVTESSKGRTTIVTLPDGTTAQRTSKTMTYTHAVVSTRNNRAEARSLRAQADRHEAYVKALQQWIKEGEDFSKLEHHKTGTGELLKPSYERRKTTEGYLPGFGPVEKGYTGRGLGARHGTYLADEGGFGIPNPNDPYNNSDEYRRIHGGTAYEQYGPRWNLADHTGKAAKLRQQADQLDAGPAETHDVVRWSQSLPNAQKGVAEFEQRRNTRLQIVGVGGTAKETPAAGPGRHVPFNAKVANGGGIVPRREGETEMAYSLRNAPSNDAAERLLQGYTLAGLRAAARDNGVSVRAGATKGQLVAALLQALRLRLLDSQAISKI